MKGNKTFITPSWSSPKGGSRGCLCPDGTYNRKCCDGSLQAQGIGVIQKVEDETTLFLLTESNAFILQETTFNILKEN